MMQSEYTSRIIHLPKGRTQLMRVLLIAGDVLHISDVSTTLNLSRSDAGKRLSRWMQQGWLRRVGRGAYIPVPLDALDADRVLDDPWVLVPALFSPGYIAGRTAAEHWGLTEQIFSDIVVITAQQIRVRHQYRHGTEFTLKHLRKEKIYGTRVVWRHNTKVQISDLQRTMVDMLDEPALGGGIQHVSDCLKSYLKHQDRDDLMLMEYAKRLDNGAIFKRLGFLAECEPLGLDLADQCRPNLTKGNAMLGCVQDSRRLVSKWRLFVPETWNWTQP